MKARFKVKFHGINNNTFDCIQFMKTLYQTITITAEHPLIQKQYGFLRSFLFCFGFELKCVKNERGTSLQIANYAKYTRNPYTHVHTHAYLARCENIECVWIVFYLFICLFVYFAVSRVTCEAEKMQKKKRKRVVLRELLSHFMQSSA